MKQIYTLCLVLLFSLNLAAQVNSKIKIFTKKPHADITGQVHDIIGDGGRPLEKEEFKAVMVSQDSMLVGIKRTELSTISGTSDYFCWYICYTAQAAGTLPVWKAMDSLRLYQNDTVTNFSVYLEPSGTTGKACYRYVFYPENAPSDSSFVDICFDLQTVGVEENVKSEFSFYPNPANGRMFVELGQIQPNGATLSIIDLSGKTVQTQILSAQTNEVSTTGLSKGMYLLQVRSGNRTMLNQEKLIVN